MRKIQLLALALAAVCAVSVVAVASASALVLTPALFLINGVDVVGKPAATTKGGLELENVLNGGAILCEGTFDGTLSEEQYIVTEVLNTSGAKIAELDESGATGGISCTGTKLCGNGSEIWPGKLPWTFDAYQDLEDVPATEWVEVLSTPSYFILCLTIIGTVEELCEAQTETAGQVLEVTGGLEPTGSSNKLGPCNGNAEDGLLLSDPLGLFSTTAGTLTISLP